MPVARVVWLRQDLAKNAISEKDRNWLNDFNEQVNYREQYYRNNPLERENFERKAYLEGFAEIKIYHYHTNHLGTPQELSNDKGDIVWLSYDRAWGGQFDCFYNNQEVGNISVSEHELQPIKFQGQFFDVETGLHYNRFRYYDSDVGMFISRDPIGLDGGDNVFQYAPNPLLWIDPFGLATFSGQSWGQILSCNYGVEKTNPSYHAHHIVFKGQFTRKPDIRLQLFRSRYILKKYGININSKANLIWAPNRGHTEENARAVADALSEEHNKVQKLLNCKCISKAQAKKNIENALQCIGKKIWLGT